VSVPVDDWDVETAEPIVARPRIPGFAPDPDALGELVTALDASERPAIVAGPAVDADGAVPDLVTLAERLKAGVWASAMSPRCSFPEDHPLFRGFIQPERRATATALADHDLVIVLGAPAFTYHVYRGESDIPLPPLFIVSDDEQVLARAVQGTGIRATAKVAIRALTEQVSESGRATPVPLSRPSQPVETSPISPEYAYATLAELLPDNAIVVEETPSHRNVLHDHFPIKSTDTGFLTMASGCLGYGLPAAIGAAMARPERKVVAVIGDGSSMYCVQALWTAAQEQVPVTFVILDNSQYAAVRILGEAAGGKKLPGVDLGGIDFVALASSLGCAAHYVEQASELKPTLSAALADLRPHLLHVRVDPNPQVLY
jgi:benzoylformate decarboxylase